MNQAPSTREETPITATSLFPPVPESVGAVRRFVWTSLFAWDRGLQREIVILLASELATNVIEHTGPHESEDEFIVNLHQIADRVRVEVIDGDPKIPAVGDGALDKRTGRGLLLLDILATSWGGIPWGSGKMLWFEVQA